jgi:hypothetical protein
MIDAIDKLKSIFCGQRGRTGRRAMTHYIRIAQGEETTYDIWEIKKRIARRVDVVPSPLTTHHAEPGESALATLQKRFSSSTFYELQNKPGEYFPCMARPSSCVQADSPGYNPDKSDKIRNSRTVSTGQLHALIGQLEKICRVVHPAKGRNYQVFGHEIRNVLILASTEVELHWKRILAANKAKGKNTHDYAKLALPMRLGEYCVDFPYYPWLQPVRPFEKWGPSKSPSKDLDWYAAYNAVKHDRETHFAEATLERAFRAVAASFVMLCGQHGWDFALRGNAALRAFLRLREAPKWDPSEIYVPPYNGRWRPKNYGLEK